VTPNKGSASKRLKIFEEITSPQADTSNSAATTAARGEGQSTETRRHNNVSVTTSYLESQESEEIEESIDIEDDNEKGQ